MFCFPFRSGDIIVILPINYAESTCVVNLLTAITELISVFFVTTLFIFVARKSSEKLG